MKHFRQYSRQDVLHLTHIRKFETKLGEQIDTANEKVDLQKELTDSPTDYVVFGIPEDIGIRANYGAAGAGASWNSFLQSFLNIQSNDFLTGEEVLLLGHFDFASLMILIEQNASGDEEKINAYRHAVITIDEEVEELVRMISSAGKIPIAIGGGHNNAYPLLKGAAKGLLKAELISLAQINCINLSAHANFRPIEGRHSGNGFRYAEEDGFLEKYCIIGLHEDQLPQNVWLDMANNPFVDFISYEDLFIREKKNFMHSVAHAVAFTNDNYTGVELDLDAIQSAFGGTGYPTGLSVLQARQYTTYTSGKCKTAYLHIAEGVGQVSENRKPEITGKLISSLVSDFIKGRAE